MHIFNMYTIVQCTRIYRNVQIKSKGGAQLWLTLIIVGCLVWFPYPVWLCGRTVKKNPPKFKFWKQFNLPMSFASVTAKTSHFGGHKTKIRSSQTLEAMKQKLGILPLWRP